MAKSNDKQRIIALQKSMAIAKRALERLAHYDIVASTALDEINRLDWNTKPTPLQGLCGHEGRPK